MMEHKLMWLMVYHIWPVDKNAMHN